MEHKTQIWLNEATNKIKFLKEQKRQEPNSCFKKFKKKNKFLQKNK